MRAFYRWGFTLCFSVTLLGCAGDARVLQESISALRQGEKFNDLAKTAPMLPILGYLRVHSARGATLLIWSFVDKGAKADLPTDVWQSGSGEIVKLQAGRLVHSSGLDSDWLAARYEGAPSWTEVLANSSQTKYTYQRALDIKANYQFGKTQQLVLTRVPQPTGHALAAVQQPEIVWFEEKVVASDLPSNIYGVVPNWGNSGQAKVAYTWHCFTANECMGFQVWTTIDQDYPKAAKP